MRILIAEDDFVSRKFLFKVLSQYGECDMTVDGIETVEAFAIALESGNPYDLLCLDIMMPKIDGLKALKAIRELESKKKVKDSKRCKVIMISALSETEVEFDSFKREYEVYRIKPVDIEDIVNAMKELKLLS
ncbi:MAG: response regulator [Epulopiscium sp.]|nr:response regulator [Candidatus Epulonipiscium sp.]